MSADAPPASHAPPLMPRWAEALIDERTIVSIIVVNSLAIFLRGFPQLRDAYDFFLFGVDYACTLYFLVEVTLKLTLIGPRHYLKGWWNWFDFLVVVISLPTLLTPLIELSDFSIVLILRTGRLLRSFRLLRFLPDADRLWSGIRRGLRASIGVVLALGLYNFTLGLGACWLFAESAPDTFGDPLMSMYSMFKVFTVEGWFDIPDAIAAQSTPLMATLVRAFFVFAVATGGMLGLSMANAVFVDEMVRDNNDELEADIIMLKQEIIALREQNRSEFSDLDKKLDTLLTSMGHSDEPARKQPES
jgi:voltage-gated sodium channel